MSTLSEIEAAVEKLPPLQQDVLHAFLTERIKKRGLSPNRQQVFATWIKTARNAGVPGMTTEAMMRESRGQE